jgi:hypothetical protein
MRSPKGTYTATALAIGVLTITMGCSSHSGASSSTTAANPSIGAPLTTSIAASSGTWATFPMGHLDDPTNTFWELFTLPSSGQRWAQHTPPDVADNGGLVIAPTGAGAVVGFRPSQLLSFSPLASTEDGGTTYTPGLLSGGLANVPDALSVSPSGAAAALTATQVLTSSAALTTWQPVTTLAAIAASPAGQACGVRQLTAVMTTGMDIVVGASCSKPGVVGLLQRTGSALVSAGVLLPTTDANDVIDVLRIAPYKQGVAALIDVHHGSATGYIAAWNPTLGSPTWTLSAPEPVGGALLSTGVTSDSGFVVLAKSSSGALTAAAVAGPASAWTQLATPPPGTATISVSSNRSDALVAGSDTFTDYQLTGGRWVKAQTVQVAIPYGSSG